MRRARQGDDEAYRRLLGHVSVWLRVVVRRGLVAAGRGTADCEDVVQEALLAMHLKRDTWDEAQPLEPDPGTAGEWRVEADFIDSIRLGAPVTLTNFEDGLLYMRVTEAVTRSRLEGRAVDIATV